MISSKVRVATTAYLSLVLVLVIGSASGAPVKITVWESFPERDQFRINQELAAEFNKLHPDIEVEVLGISYGTYPDRFIPSVIAGAGPDAFAITYVWVGYAARGLLVDLTPYAKRDGVLEQIRTDTFPGAQTGIWWQGGLYAVPTSVGGGVMYYNPSLLAESGVPEPKLGWTWEDWRSLGKRVQRTESDGQVRVHGILAYHPWSGALPIWVQAGARFFDTDFRRAVVDQDLGIREALTFLGEMVDAGVYGYSGNFGFDTNEAFRRTTSSRVGFWLDIPRPKDLGAPIWENLRIAPALSMPGGEPATYAHWSGWAAVKSGDPKREAAAWEYIKWLTSPEKQGKEVALRGLISDLPARRSVLRQRSVVDLVNRDENWARIVQQVIPYGRSEGLFGAPIMDQFQGQVLSPALTEAIRLNRRPVPERVEKMQFDTQKLLDEFWK
ncbi:MAG: ABC transporter substrate-binding protein [Limnochordia bacterium]